ncbi:hypothetical protein GCM10010389_49070 [Streptomyces echinoruber]|uniref:Uncharacterized protein n=1 Tax=Streptomyces echinoruber TaxID=68898 RepID=A0A918VK14_9ACTN|nr:hypothetical protein GCM10010389_49070 [Streptomyces echinoruber]
MTGVAIQLPMIPEAVFAMPACTRLGLPHSVVFGGFPRTIPQAQELSAVLAAAGRPGTPSSSSPRPRR